MYQLGGLFAGLKTNPDEGEAEDFAAISAFPNESACPVCHYFDVTHPAVRIIIAKRDPFGKRNLLANARCKCGQRDKDKMIADNRRHDSATLPHGETPKTFDNFLQRTGTEEMLAAARAFAEGAGIRFLTIQGDYGNGKSHVMEAMARQMLKQGAPVKYTLAKDFLDRLRGTYDRRSDDDFYNVLGEYMDVYALFLDDLGAEAGTDWASSQLTGLVESRIQNGACTVISTNTTREQMMGTNPRLADRVFATNPALGHAIKVVTNTATSYRK